MNRVVFDLDGVLATGTKENVYSDEAGWAYDKCVLIKSTERLIRRLYESGVTIIFNTARHECDREKTEFWLKKHSIPYSYLYMGKPFGDLYIDDKSFPTGYLPSEKDDADYTAIMDALSQNRNMIGQIDGTD